MMKMRDAMRVVDQYRGGAFVIAAHAARGGWADVSHNKELDLSMAGAMGKSSSLALGVALAKPGRKVILFNGDGALLMNLGTLVTEAQQAPPNLCHIVLENGLYATTGGQPIPGKDRVDFAGMARSAGYRRVFRFDDLEEFASKASEIFTQPGLTFLCLRVEPEIETRPINQRPNRPKPPFQTYRALKERL
ncbi:MAG: thiamine pyrophosphate-binding protein [Chloroflexi bacterium]|nr:thiamine pyrophosphate-binding protein [Chloroflexota bacterium]